MNVVNILRIIHVCIKILMPFSSFKRVSTSCDVIEKWFAKQIGPLHFAMVTTHCA